MQIDPLTESVADEIAQRLSPFPEQIRLKIIERSLAKAVPHSHDAGLPSWALDSPKVQKIPSASVGSAVVPIFRDKGVWKAVVGVAGEHYGDAEPPRLIVFGGFIDLKNTPGTSLTPANPGKAESQSVGAVRELEEELKDGEGNPVLPIDPKRLVIRDAKVLNFANGEHCVANGFVLQLNDREKAKIIAHVDRMADAAYAQTVRNHTLSPLSRKPEIHTHCIIPLDDLADGKHILLHPDQRTLFQNIRNELMQRQIP